MRRLITALSLVFVALAAGCGSGTEARWTAPASAPAISAADPVDVIKQAIQRSLSSTLTIQSTVKAGGLSIELAGKADPKAKVIQVSGKAPDPIEARVIGDAAYLKTKPAMGDKPWTKIDMTKLRPDSSLRQSFDLKTQTGIVGGVVSAEKVAEGRYRGTTDLTKAAEAAGANTTMRDSLESGAKLAKNPKAIPFEASVDPEGRLTALSYTIETSMGDFVTDVQMSGFGEPVTVTEPPADEVGEATDEMYRFF